MPEERLQKVIAASGLENYAANRVLFRFMRLGLLHAGPITQADEVPAVELQSAA